METTELSFSPPPLDEDPESFDPQTSPVPISNQNAFRPNVLQYYRSSNEKSQQDEYVPQAQFHPTWNLQPKRILVSSPPFSHQFSQGWS
ncbi:hypothetical protein BLNAU_6337 [Blattamonas nauphoetae]|uniref:Uncharacterized protein n=1 Tax=Blattamonas nauphoetae TaxID=2049346 RepID=A0ABQ9Y4E6_9EUKA|nr:hypothetical protein BLNAU_6337 [Blattamonas nauphoetae]